MKLIFSFLIVFLSISLLLIQTNSFSRSEISNEAILSIATEENAPISVTYGKDNRFTVINRTESSIKIVSIELLDNPDQAIIEAAEIDSYQIRPGGVKEFVIPGNLEDRIGGTIKLNIHWDGGRAEIKSTIPERIGET
ncbi:hypothetical protein V7147_17960 [Bacillus sp. JJ1521]|uniref:hypothetical protein n=1 Tax=Bacillus sp. JJ1521 TaxID=3122957 RepID=UPI002FFFA3B5